MSRTPLVPSRGFSLAETLLALSIGGTILAYCVPGVARAESRYRARVCATHLRVMETAVEQWSVENHTEPGSKVSLETLLEMNPHLQSAQTCPEGGMYQRVFVFGDSPRCSLGTQGDTNPENDHRVEILGH
jgi:competence protein ComGC